MTKDEALKIVLEALTTLNDEADPADKIDVGAQTHLFGATAVIDSLALVSMIVDVEEAASDAAGRMISLTDDRAMSQPVSPFTTADSLADYIAIIANERS